MDELKEESEEGSGAVPTFEVVLHESGSRRSSHEGGSRRSSLKDKSDGKRPSIAEFRTSSQDSETLSESEEEYFRKMLSERRGSFRPQPKQTVAYEVQTSDTLEGIAIRYNITPSELCVLNKLSSRMVFPGQTIYIPEKNSLQVLEEILKSSAAALASSSDDPNSPKPGRVERLPGISVESVDGKISEPEILKEHTEEKKSLRVNSKYVTDGEGVVSGMLIVTSNHIIFDPNVSDPLVIEYGMDKYGVEAPMNCTVRAALYTDIFRMRSKDNYLGGGDSNMNVYHSKNLSMKKSKSYGEKLSKTAKQLRRFSAAELSSKRHELSMPTSNSFQENLSKICESTDADEEEEEDESQSSSFQETPSGSFDQQEHDIADQHDQSAETKNNLSKTALSRTSSHDSEDNNPSRKTSFSDDDFVITSVETNSPKKKSNFEKTKHKFSKGLRKFSLSDGLFSNAHGGRRMSLPAFASLPDAKHKNASKSNGASDTSARSADDSKPGNAVYVNMVDEKPELFAPFDKLIPRPAKSFCNTPLYLCLRMGEPINKTGQTSNTVIHFSHKMKPEYWFSIPKDSVDDLYFFFLRWCPEKYGDIESINMEDLGYYPIDDDESYEEMEEKPVSNQRRASWMAFPWRKKAKDAPEVASPCSPESSWEVVEHFPSKSEEIFPPELLTPSKILSDEQILEINNYLPARAMNPWNLVYGTASHGFSLKTMYRAMARYESPVLIVIQNRNDVIFGALLSHALKMSDHFYGTGESFVFTFQPQFKVYRWAGENSYFIKGNIDSFMVGSSEGHFGLWLDDDLFRGCTNSCQTFANDPLCPEEDFEVKALEAWAFV